MFGSCGDGPVEPDHWRIPDCLEVGTHMRNGVGGSHVLCFVFMYLVFSVVAQLVGPQNLHEILHENYVTERV